MKRKPRLRAIKKALRKPDLYTPKEYERLMSGFYDELVRDEPVSYTHLTLPTIYSV